MIRALSPEDLDDVTSVLGLARLYQGDGLYLIAWVDDEPAGHLYLQLADPPELQDVEVREAFRGQGIAAELIAAAERECAMRAVQTVRVTVSEDNDVARRLYARLGYADAGVEPRRFVGTVMLRTGPIEVDDTILTLEKSLSS